MRNLPNVRDLTCIPESPLFLLAHDDFFAQKPKKHVGTFVVRRNLFSNSGLRFDPDCPFSSSTFAAHLGDGGNHHDRCHRGPCSGRRFSNQSTGLPWNHDNR